jgi:hypothetical protein
VAIRRKFWKATAISFAAYAFALPIRFGVDLRLALFVVLALQATWTLLCVARLAQLRLGRSYRSEPEPYEREDYGFALGGAVSSVALFIIVVVLT